MGKTVNISVFGKAYDVPKGITLLNAFEYAGLDTVKGSGCKNGVCGACSALYKMEGEKEIKSCLACQKTVEDGMCILKFPLESSDKKAYNIEKNENIMNSVYPEIYSCVGCNLCTKLCVKKIDVKRYIEYAQKGDFAKCAQVSSECVMCSACSVKCPAGIDHKNVALLAKRITGKYIIKRSKSLEKKLKEVKSDGFIKDFEDYVNMPESELKGIYNESRLKSR